MSLINIYFSGPFFPVLQGGNQAMALVHTLFYSMLPGEPSNHVCIVPYVTSRNCHLYLCCWEWASEGCPSPWRRDPWEEKKASVLLYTPEPHLHSRAHTTNNVLNKTDSCNFKAQRLSRVQQKVLHLYSKLLTHLPTYGQNTLIALFFLIAKMTNNTITL